MLVGPATRTATEGSFHWGPTEDVAVIPGAKPLVACYLDRPIARPSGQAGRRRLAASAPLVAHGLYQQLLVAWVGVAPEEGEEALRAALPYAQRVPLGQTRAVTPTAPGATRPSPPER